VGSEVKVTENIFQKYDPKRRKHIDLRFVVDFYLVHGLIAKRLDEDDRNNLNYFECPEVQLGLHAT